MDVKTAINTRRAYRSLEPVKITKEIINDLACCAQLSASCFNNQPWRFIFVYEPQILKKMHDALSEGNEWATKASMIIVVISKKEYDCIIREREYYFFDTGMASALIILRATELGLVAHPIAGFSPRKIREILKIPEEMEVITLIIVGKHSEKISPLLSEKQIDSERSRPKRLPIEKFTFLNSYNEDNK